MQKNRDASDTHILRLGTLFKQELGRHLNGSTFVDGSTPAQVRSDPARLLAIWGVGSALSVRVARHGRVFDLDLKRTQTKRLSPESVTLLSVRPPCAVVQTDLGRERLCMPVVARLVSESAR